MSPHGDTTNSYDDMDPASKIASLLSMGVYTLSKEKQNKIVNSLRSRGIDSIIPPLPKIVLVGNQSSGKSALIEAISRIKLPSAMGTTTRCPMEIILKSSKALDVPHYKVSLRRDSSLYSPSALKKTTADFDETFQVDDLTLIIRRAQLAILNPNKDIDDFLILSEKECENYQSELTFSQDIVVVDIEDAAEDVTFIDLPGLISNAPKVFPSQFSWLTNCRVARRTALS